MPEYVATIVAALIGALFGSIGAAWYEYRRKHEDEIRLAREKLIERYLLQLQDAAESLWHRLKNVRERGGRTLMSDSYYEVSTLYALGRVLAYERILLLDGVYLQLKGLKKFDPMLGPFLKDTLRSMDNILDEGKFHRYDRLTLAEAATERGEGFLHTRAYSEFKRSYDAPDSLVRASLEPAKEFIETPRGQTLDKLMSSLQDISKKLSATTEITTTVYERQTAD